jgi:hypothetical protein
MTNPWKNVRVYKGKLVGKLTDNLVANAYPLESKDPVCRKLESVKTPVGRQRKNMLKYF